MLKDAAYELAQAGKPSAFIAERLTAAYDLGSVTVRQVNRWLNERFNATRDETIANVFNDVEYLRQRAYDATEKSRNDAGFLGERNYWWSLYVSALHITLRTALAPVAEPAGRLQFVYPNNEGRRGFLCGDTRAPSAYPTSARCACAGEHRRGRRVGGD